MVGETVIDTIVSVCEGCIVGKSRSISSAAVGVEVGAAVVSGLAPLVGRSLDGTVGSGAGDGVGSGLGLIVGPSVGAAAGAPVGTGAGVGDGVVGSFVGRGVCAFVGTTVGTGVGAIVGVELVSGVGDCMVGSYVGLGVENVGAPVGTGVGSCVGSFVGLGVGAIVGANVGIGVGAIVGNGVGASVGNGVGLLVGATVGDCVVGKSDGGGVGLGVGCRLGVEVMGVSEGFSVLGSTDGQTVGGVVGCIVGPLLGVCVSTTETVGCDEGVSTVVSGVGPVVGCSNKGCVGSTVRNEGDCVLGRIESELDDGLCVLSRVGAWEDDEEGMCVGCSVFWKLIGEEFDVGGVGNIVCNVAPPVGRILMSGLRTGENVSRALGGGVGCPTGLELFWVGAAVSGAVVACVVGDCDGVVVGGEVGPAVFSKGVNVGKKVAELGGIRSAIVGLPLGVSDC